MGYVFDQVVAKIKVCPHANVKIPADHRCYFARLHDFELREPFDEIVHNSDGPQGDNIFDGSNVENIVVISMDSLQTPAVFQSGEQEKTVV